MCSWWTPGWSEVNTWWKWSTKHSWQPTCMDSTRVTTQTRRERLCKWTIPRWLLSIVLTPCLESSMQYHTRIKAVHTWHMQGCSVWMQTGRGSIHLKVYMVDIDSCTVRSKSKVNLTHKEETFWLARRPRHHPAVLCIWTLSVPKVNRKVHTPNQMYERSSKNW